MEAQELRRLLRVGDQLELEPEQLAGSKPPYTVLSIDGNLVKVTSSDGFRLLPLYLLVECVREGRLRQNGQRLLPS